MSGWENCHREDGDRTQDRPKHPFLGQKPIEDSGRRTIQGPNLQIAGQGLSGLLEIPRAPRRQAFEKIVVDQVGIRLEGTVQIVQSIPIVPLQKIGVRPGKVAFGLVELSSGKLGPHRGHGGYPEKQQYGQHQDRSSHLLLPVPLVSLMLRKGQFHQNSPRFPSEENHGKKER